MKNIALFACLTLVFSVVFMVVLNVGSNIDRREEIEDSLSLSMRNTLKATSVNEMYPIDSSEMSAELLRNLAENINTDGEYDVFVYGADPQGLLDVKLRETHENINGQITSSELRKTLILEEASFEEGDE